MSFIFGLFITAAVYGCAPEKHIYSADPVSARVVDAGTGKPLEGVVVVAYWELYQGSLTGDGMPCGAANVEETVTDKDGWFRIPGWGPVKGACGMMRNMNPFVYMFKPGYEYLRKSGGIGFNSNKLVSVAQVDWNGQVIKLNKYQHLDLSVSGLGSYENNFSLLNGDLSMFTTYMPSQCNWKKIPKMLRAIAIQANHFAHARGYQIGSIVSQLISNNQQFQNIAPQCGSPKQFVKGLLR
ncbi:MAG: hypothetical protein ACYDB9_07985 [Gammaproteobacteria bacterium]